MSRLRAYARLGRVSNLPTVWTNVLAGIALGGGIVAPARVAVIGAAASSAYVGGMFLNDAFDRHVDARERPERPIPSGVVSAVEVFSVGIFLLGLAVAVLAIASLRFAPDAVLESVAAGLGLAACIVLYDAWHKQNPAAPVVMGLCRGAVYASAALASGGSLRSPLLLGAAAMVAYVFGLTAVARQENRRRFSGAWRLALLAAPVVVVLLAPARSIETWAALALFVTWGGVAVAPLFARGDVDVPRSVVRMIAGISLLDGMIAAAYGAPLLALLGVVGLVTTLALQRFVRGT